MKKVLLPFAVLFLIITQYTFSQNIEDDTRVKDALNLIEVWIESQLAYDQIPGISMGIVYDQNLIWSKGFGVTDLEKNTPAAPNTIYSICSISKLFTSIAVMQLRDKKLLRLDDPVSKHLPWFKIEQLYPDGPPITIEALLTHSSGLPRESDFTYWNYPDYQFPTREEMIEKLKYQKTLYPADEHYQYSNLGLTLAGEIVLQVSGKNYEEYIEENIIQPLGLTDTRTCLPEELYGGRLATGYSATTREGRRIKQPFFRCNAITPAAGFSSTVEDLARFAEWQLRLLEKGGTEILSANTLREMQRVHWLEPDWKTTRGLGFGVYRKGDINFVGHMGSCPGYGTALMIHPKTKIATIFMANALNVGTEHFSQTTYKIISPSIEAALNSPGSGKESKADFDKYIGTYTFDPWGGEAAIIHWEGGLAMVDLPSSNPLESLSKLKYIEGDTFKRIRDDGELGEEIIFIFDESGKVKSFYQHSNYWPKIK
jgi:CubicO group peptidase (beta-lactamase class C family)